MSQTSREQTNPAETPSPAVTHFADRLFDACRKRGAAVCVGVDPVWEHLPASVTRGQRAPEPSRAAEAIEPWGRALLDVLVEHVPVVKFQSACFERYGAAGIATLSTLIAHARRLGLLVIVDAKRGDVASTTRHYAAALLDGDAPADAVTVNPYMGADAVEPFVEAAKRRGGGVFALVRTSNASAEAVQGLALADGRTVAEAVADLIASWGEREPAMLGSCGYSLLGAVVGATQSAALRQLRRRMPRQVLLLPGVGAQGGSVADLRACFDDQGLGGLISASRSVIFAHQSGDSPDWRTDVAHAAEQLAGQARALLGE